MSVEATAEVVTYAITPEALSKLLVDRQASPELLEVIDLWSREIATNAFMEGCMAGECPICEERDRWLVEILEHAPRDLPPGPFRDVLEDAQRSIHGNTPLGIFR